VLAWTAVAKGAKIVPTRSIDLTEHYDQFVESQLASGRYKNAGEVMRAGLRLLERQEREEEEKLAALRRLAAEAFDELDRGDAIVIEGDAPLADFISTIGQRVGRNAEHSPRDA
jgi:antitoxin ParD1/3/4